ncbi:MAG: peptidoglycan DD-metalloendopeptidase family protein, partial [Clostridia bacterium]|nr:peptidoglycan DD-metalloendopeptidase family protein [Clostridia bacterium]
MAYLMKENRFFSQLKKRLLSAVVAFGLAIGAFSFYGTGADSGYDLPWLWPVPGSYKINCLDYYYNGGVHNQGQCVDIGANGYTGDTRLDVVSATSGSVLFIRDEFNETDNRGSGWGNYVIVRTGDICVVYAHLQSVSVKGGQSVKAGQVLGKMGNTGNSTGVHLHLQAYPLGDSNGYQSTAIYVFDKFTENPLYYPKFQFMKGLATYSARYGEWIKEYYKNVSGAYYTYSGGVVSDYDLTYVDARLRVYATSGAVLRTLPLNDNQYIRETAEYGSYVNIIGYTFDAYGEIWLKTDSDLWMTENGVGFYDYNDSLDIFGENLPEGAFGNLADASVSGTVSSGNPIVSFSAQILSGETVISERRLSSVSVMSIDISEVASQLLTGTLDDGSYTFRISATASSQYPNQAVYSCSKVLAESEFTMDSYLSDRIPPIIEAIDFALNGASLEISVTATDASSVKSVVLNVSHSEEKKSYTASGKGPYTSSVSLADFSSATGDFNVEVTAADEYDNVSTDSRTVTVPASGDGEVWECTYSAVNTRKEPNTSSDKGEQIVKGTQVSFSNFSETTRFLWGQLENGYWTAVRDNSFYYYKYISGYTYTVALNFNGGTGTMTEIGKRYGQPAVLPSEVPAREGYTFAGWATSSSAKNAEYPAGAEYFANANALLFAVWKDSTPPEISSVDISPEGWVGDGVIVTVSAADDSGTLYYSFDGGSTWTLESTLYVRENTVIDAGKIVVRDGSGNTAAYGESLTVSNIDKTPPSVENASASISSTGTKVTFEIHGVTDGESGIEKYEAVLSKTSDFASVTIRDITSGAAVTVSNGIWYWKLRATDKAGNVSSRSFGRFRVGNAEKLDVPDSLTVVNAGSSFVELIWNGVDNADGYTVAVSQKADFNGYDIYTFPSCAATVYGLEAGKNYYVRVSASCSDMVYSASDFGASVSFITLSDDSSIHGFEDLEGATVEDSIQQCYAVLPYSADVVNVRAILGQGAVASYFSDSGEIAEPGAFVFSGSSANVYIEVTAENGTSTRYTLLLTRAGRAAEIPVVFVENTIPASVIIGQPAGTLEADARVADGGTLTYEWFVSVNGASPESVGTDSSVTVPTDRAGSCEIYVIVTNTNVRCLEQVSSAESGHIVYTVEKILSPITVVIEDFEYNGMTASAAVRDYSGDGEVSVRFYREEECLNEITAPSAVGVYYVLAEATETDTYAFAVSPIVRLTISKASRDDIPEYTVTEPTLRVPTTDVTVYGDGVEYRIGEGEWTDLTAQETFTLAEGETIQFRYKETANTAAGNTVTVVAAAYDGATAIVPDGIGYTLENGMLFVNYLVTAAVTKSDVFAGLEKFDHMTVYDAEGNEVADGEVITTGCRIVLADEQGEIDSALIIVRGDVDCDGYVTMADVRVIMRISNGMARPENG